jgi:D-sedoheptulose 7-phosphate isomerase
MERDFSNYIDLLIRRYPLLKAVRGDVARAYQLLENCYENAGKLLIAGNGGSAADADHIVGELMKGFRKQRKIPTELAQKLEKTGGADGLSIAEKLQGALPAIALHNHAALNTAYLNDVDGLFCFAQQVYGFGKEGDVFWGISTSGNSKDVLYAAVTAKALGMKVIGLTGRDGGKLKTISDVAVVVPETETYMIQELHLPVYHCLCLMLEDFFFQE